jgi:predicted RNase H-like HicB family nuclease/uncharacterized damage-inducible protein DinB
MSEYQLYVESGPKHRKTMVHVPALLGCIAQGPTTEEALAATPLAIRRYLAFERRHGAAMDPEAPLETVVAEHVTEGSWIGQGDPEPGFRFDFNPPPEPEELTALVGRLGWQEEELVAAFGAAPPQALLARPDAGGRSLLAMADHLAGAHAAYLRYQVGKVPGLAEAAKSVPAAADPAELSRALAELWRLSRSRVAAMTADEVAQRVQHGKVTWTTRRMLRRMLEHEWEHLEEIRSRGLQATA